MSSAIAGTELDPKLEDELLKDDDIDEDEKSLLDSTHDLLKSPESSKSSTPETPAVKKVSLKRNTSIAMPVIEKNDEATEKPSTNTSGEPEKKVIKISKLSEQERLELRAKKFSVNENTTTTSSLDGEDKLMTRAARFGITAPNTTVATSKSSITAPTTVSEVVLKKRAERFGAISSDVKKLELDEKLQKRKERFGMAEKVTLTSAAATEQAEKARLRLERFKTTA